MFKENLGLCEKERRKGITFATYEIETITKIPRQGARSQAAEENSTIVICSVGKIAAWSSDLAALEVPLMDDP